MRNIPSKGTRAFAVPQHILLPVACQISQVKADTTRHTEGMACSIRLLSNKWI